MAGIFKESDKSGAYGIALLRIATGFILFQAGYGKVFIKGLSAVAQGFERMGMFLPQITGPFVGILELVGGAALILGLFTRYLGLVFAIQFVVATYAKIELMNKGLSGANIDILLVVIGLVLATQGGGALNLGNLLKKGH